ncbi:MAG: DUF3618 domain-containing protein [Candidatus Eremiobacteraeota bacterium]|nr:DUF3618 domain-containing protein [Candidatus Eremiobacteraeota bacterium]
MGKEPDDIRQQIERTRGRIEDTADAIGYKADVPSRVRDSINNRIDGAKRTIRDSVDTLSSGQEQLRSAQRRVLDNPLGLVLGAVAAGFLVGSLLPSTELEERSLSPLADKLQDAAQQTDLVGRGRQILHETASAAKESAKRQADEVTQTLSERTPADDL